MKDKNLLDFLKKKKIISKLYQRTNRPYLYDFAIKFRTPSNSIYTAGSAKIKKRNALKGAIGEFFEIYSALDYKSHPSKKKKVKEIDFPFGDYIKLSQKDYNKKRYSMLRDSSLIYAIRGKELFSNSSCFLPSFSIYLAHLDKDKFYPVMSHGLGSQTSLRKAITHGLKEIIEADASIIWWRKGGKTFIVDKIKSPQILNLIKKINAENMKIETYFVTQDIPLPVFISVISSNKKPYISVGVGSSFNIEKGIIKSIEESLLLRNSLENYLKIKPFKIGMKRNEINCYFDHAIYHALNKIDYKSKFSFKKISLSEIKRLNLINSFTDLCIFLKNKGFKVYWTELTPTFIKKISSYKQVKVVCPKLIPININPHYLHLDSSRINLENVNYLIHPFG